MKRIRRVFKLRGQSGVKGLIVAILRRIFYDVTSIEPHIPINIQALSRHVLDDILMEYSPAEAASIHRPEAGFPSAVSFFGRLFI